MSAVNSARKKLSNYMHSVNANDTAAMVTFLSTALKTSVEHQMNEDQFVDVVLMCFNGDVHLVVTVMKEHGASAADVFKLFMALIEDKPEKKAMREIGKITPAHQESALDVLEPY